MDSRQLFAAFVREADVPAQAETYAPIGRRALLRLLRAFGRSPLITDFFGIYSELKDAFESGEPGTSEFFGRLRRSMNMLDSRLENDATRARLSQKQSEIAPLLRRLDNGQMLPSMQWRRIIDSYADMIQTAASDKGVYLTSRRLPGTGPVRWLRLQKASAREEATEKLRRDDPDLFQRTLKSRDQRRLINERIRDRIIKDGMVPEVRTILNRPVNVGVSADDADEIFVYDDDGDVLLIGEFIEKIKNRGREQRGLLNVNIPQLKGWGTGLDRLRSVSEEEIQARLNEGAVVEYLSLTDDPDKDTALTRIYPVIDIDGEQVVSAGRFRGIKVPDLVNEAGRQIEGSVYYIDPRTRRIARREVLAGPDGQIDVRDQVEPYVTVDGDRLFMRVYLGRAYTETRRRLRKLSNAIPSVEYVPGSRSSAYWFEPKDFAAVRQQVGGMALSGKAAKLLQEYFEELSRAEQAANAENLTRYSSDSLGLKLPLRQHTKRALAWLDANGNKGICALDTGMGKTVTAIAAMQNLIKKGDAEEGNGRFLYVCEQALLGNLPKEIFKFMPADEANDLIERVDITTYLRFNRARKADSTYGDDYVAIYFDEAHLKLDKKSKSSYRSTVNCKCPRKVLMTASPMVKSPKEVLTLASVALGIDLNTKEGRAWERKFLNRFAESVGGRVVGITQDPVAARDFRVWVKRNLFFADKRDVAEEEAQLDELRQETVAVTMPPGIEDAYREAMAEVMELLKPLVGLKYDPKDDRSLPLAAEEISRRLSRPLGTLNKLSNTPDRVIPGAPNPKLESAVNLVRHNIGKRVLLFTDSADFASDTFQKMQQQFPGRGHVVGYSGFILYVSPTGEEQKFTPRQYTDPATGRKTKRDEWKTHVLTKILGLGNNRTDYDVMTCCLTGSYAVGQNLQSFETVIHLDRDDWSSETMKQRTARAWRSGNKQPVDEYTLDLVYSDVVADDDAEKTLDELRRVIQEIDANLFDRVVLDSQVEKLGEEWLSIKKQRSALHVIDRRMMERAMSPYANQLGQQEVSV